MAVKLMLDADRINTGRAYSCAANTRNGACPNNTITNHYVGEGEDRKRFTLCRRHERMYDAELATLQALVQSEHEQGLHGEGEERRAFSEQHVRNTWFIVNCSKCRDELVSEDLGVKPEQVELANKVKHLRDRHQKAVLDFNEKLTAYVKESGAVFAVSKFAEDAINLRAEDELWLRVQAFEEGAYSWRGDEKMNLVDAYEKVAEEQRERLINDRCRNDNERYIASRFIRLAEF